MPSDDDTGRRSTRRRFRHDGRFEGAAGEDSEATPFATGVYQQSPGMSHDTSEWKSSYQSLVDGEKGDADRGAAPRPSRRGVVSCGHAHAPCTHAR